MIHNLKKQMIEYIMVPVDVKSFISVTCNLIITAEFPLNETSDLQLHNVKIFIWLYY